MWCVCICVRGRGRVCKRRTHAHLLMRSRCSLAQIPAAPCAGFGIALVAASSAADMHTAYLQGRAGEGKEGAPRARTMSRCTRRCHCARGAAMGRAQHTADRPRLLRPATRIVSPRSPRLVPHKAQTHGQRTATATATATHPLPGRHRGCQRSWSRPQQGNQPRGAVVCRAVPRAVRWRETRDVRGGGAEASADGEVGLDGDVGGRDHTIGGNDGEVPAPCEDHVR